MYSFIACITITEWRSSIIIFLDTTFYLIQSSSSYVLCVALYDICIVYICVSEWEHMSLPLPTSAGQKSMLGVFFNFHLVWGRASCFYYVFQAACRFSGKCLSSLPIPPWRSITDECMLPWLALYVFWGSKLIQHICTKSIFFHSTTSPVHFFLPLNQN